MKKLAVIFLFFYALASTFGQEVSYNESFTVLDKVDDLHIQNELSIAELKNENIIYCYKKGIREIVYQRFDSNYNKLGAEIEVYSNDNDTLKVEGFKISSLSNGGFIITWANIIRYSPYNGQMKTRVLFQLFDEEGNRVGDEKLAYDFGFEQYHPNVVTIDNSNFMIIWTQSEVESYPHSGKIVGRKFNELGEPISEIIEISLNKFNYSSNDQTVLTKLPDGGFALSWIENYMQIYVRIFDHNGDALSESSLIATNKINFDMIFSNAISLTSVSSDSILVCWLDYNEFDSGPYYIDCFITACILNRNGEKIIEDVIVKNLNGRSFPLPYLPTSMGIIKNGGVIISWTGLKNEFQAKYYSNSLKENTGEFIISEFVQYPLVLNRANDEILMTWQDSMDRLIKAKYYLETPIIKELNSFELMDPQNDIIISSIPISLSWERSNSESYCYPFEVTYDLFLDNNEDFLDPIVFNGIVDTFSSINNLIQGKTYFWKVLAKNITGDSLWSSNVNGFYIDPNVTDVETTENTVPEKFELYQNYPNPFNPSTKIKYSIPHHGGQANVERFAESLNGKNERIGNSLYNVTLKVYDVLGKEVATLVNKEQTAGSYEVEFNTSADGQNLASGIYFYRIQVDKFIDTKKMILLR